MANDDTFLEVRKYLDEAIKENGFNYRELSLQIGRKDSYLHRFVKYGQPRYLDKNDRQLLAMILGVDENKLTDKEEPVLPAHLSGIVSAADKIKSFFAKRDEVEIDILNVSACCGKGEEVDDEGVMGKIIMPSDDFRSIAFMTSPKNIKMIKAMGDSMSPTINDGDWCFVDISFKSAISDGIYLIRNKSGIAIKRLQIGFTDNVVVKSDNPCYDPDNVNLTDVNVVGRVIYVLNGRKV